MMKMKTRMVWSLALAGIILWANLSWAQCQGGGQGLCPVNQNSQNTVQGRGQGRGNANCPYYPGSGYRGGRQGQGANAQGRQGQGSAGQNAPNAAANQPGTTK